MILRGPTKIYHVTLTLCYADDIVMMIDSKGKLKEHLNKIVDESKKIRLKMKCKMEFVIVSKMDSLRQ